MPLAISRPTIRMIEEQEQLGQELADGADAVAQAVPKGVFHESGASNREWDDAVYVVNQAHPGRTT